MKLFYCFLISSLFFLPPVKINAQVILSESFEEGFPPDGWVVTNAGLGNNWTLMPANSGYQLSGLKCMQYVSSSSFSANTWIFSPGFSLSPGITYRLSYWYQEITAGKVEKMKVTIGQGQTVASQTTVLHDYPSITSTTYVQGIDDFTVPSAGTYSFALQCYSFPTTNSGLTIDSVVLEQLTPVSCSGVPPTGVVSGFGSACSGASFTLKLNGVFTGSGLSFQWQSSPEGQNNFTDIPGATQVNLTTSQTVATDYRCKVTCSNGGQTSISAAFNVKTPATCYCTPPYSVCSNNNSIANVTFAGINNNSACTSGGYQDFFHSVSAGTIAAGTSYPITVKSLMGANENVGVWIDFNRNGTFQTSEYVSLGTATGQTFSGTIAIPSTAQPGLTRMRVRLSFFTSLTSSNACSSITLGETEDYAINITPLVCSGTPPSPGTINALTRVCSGVSFPMSINGTYTGLDLQWQSSPTGANTFTNITGATTTSFTTSQTISRDYRCVVTCAASGNSVNSAIFTVITPDLCYCEPFNICGTANNITNVKFGTINNSSTCVGLAYADYTSSVAPASVMAGAFHPITITTSSPAASYVAVWIDYNKNGIFEASEYKAIGGGTGTTFTNNIFIPSVAVTGTTTMRVRRRMTTAMTPEDACLSYSAGETEDYKINILPAQIAIYFTPFKDTLYDRVIPVTARITQKDIGLNVSDTLRPRLWIRKQSSSIWKSFPGQLVSGNDKDGNWQFPVNHDSLGIRKNGCDSVQFYFVAQDLNVPFNIGYQPEVGALHSAVNVQQSPPTVLFGYRLKPRFKDTVYVSQNDCRYQSLSNENGLFEEINKRGLEGNLTIVIESDLLEKGINDITGTSQNGYSLTIRPSDNTVKKITNNYRGDASIALNGVKNVLIDGSYNGSGKYLKFFNMPNNVTYDSISSIKIQGSCDGVVLTNLVFEAVSLYHKETESAIMLSHGTNKNISVLNSFFTNGAIWPMPGKYISSNLGNNSLLIRGNEFNNFIESAVNMFNANESWIIDSNHFYRTDVPNDYSYDWRAISLKGGGHIIKNNFIGGKAPFCAGGTMSFVNNPGASIIGIELTTPSGTTSSIIENNRVDNISSSQTLAAELNSFVGITAIDNKAIIRNNIIGNPASASQTISIVGKNIRGINVYGSQPVEIRNNTVASLKNVPGNGPIGVVGMRGISKNGIGSAIITGNKIHNLYNSRNAESDGSFQAEAGTVGLAISTQAEDIVESNLIYNITVSSGAVSGIEINTATSSSAIVQRNRIYDLFNTTGSIGSCCDNNFYNGGINGILIAYSPGELAILNNQISLTNNGNTTPATIRGIYEVFATYPNSTPPRHRIIYNSVYIGGGSTLRGGSAGYFSVRSSVKEVHNNIFYNERTGGDMGHFAIRTHPSAPGDFLIATSSNQNLYVITDTTKFAETRYGNPTIAGWGVWKGVTGYDDSSYVMLPAVIPSSQLFVDKDKGNLNINNNSQLCWYINEKARPFAQIAGDYDSPNIRSTSEASGYTDIGSDEFVTDVAAPGAICAGTTKSLTSDVSGTTYQWQLKTTAGFVNINNNSNYSGTSTGILQITNVPYTWNGQEYRCVVNGNVNSSIFKLIVMETFSPSVSISTSAATICAGETVSFLATAVSAGATPTYQWLKNGTNTGTNSNNYSSSTLANGDIISVKLTSMATCVSNATVTSNTITMTVNSVLSPTITISGATTVPAGGSSLLTATASNAGGSPVYQWQDSTSAAGWQNIGGATSSTLIYFPAASNHKVRCRISVTGSCATPNTILSNTLVFIIAPVTPGSGSTHGIICYPNPATTTLFIDSLKLSDNWQTLEIRGIDGRIVMPVITITNRTSLAVPIEQLLPGMYILVFRKQNGEYAYLRFVKQ